MKKKSKKRLASTAIHAKALWMLFLLLNLSLSAQDKLVGANSSVSDVTSGTLNNFTDLTSVTLDVTGVNSVLVVASFETRYGGAVNIRDALLKLTDGTVESETIRRTLTKTGGDDKGSGTLTFIFDASGSSGEKTYTLKHTSSKAQAVVSTASLVAIALTTTVSGTELSHDLKSISNAVPTSGTLNEWTAVTGLATEGIVLPSSGSLYACASVNTAASASGTGEWKLQYSTDNLSWSDLGNVASRTIPSNSIYGISSLVYILKNLDAGTYYCRLAHRQTVGTPGHVETLNTSISACALVFEDAPGSYREFPSIGMKNPQQSTTSISMTPVMSLSAHPAYTTDMFIQAQYDVSANGESDSPTYDLSINNGILDGTDQQRYVSSNTDRGNGGIVGLGLSLLPGTNYSVSLRHRSTAGVTLTTKNSIVAGFQLTSVGNSVWTGGGISPNQWSASDNWSGGSPGIHDNAYIPGGLSNYPVMLSSESCHDLFIDISGSVTLDPGGSLDVYGLLTNLGSLSINSDASQSASLIAHGSSSGEVLYRSYLTANQWHIASPPVSGQTIQSFLLDESNQIPENTSGLYGLTDYNETTNSWNSFFTGSTGGEFISGSGYLLRKEISDGSASYSGSLVDYDLSVGISRSGLGWSAVGNPFSSAMGVTEDAASSQNFLTVNNAQLDPNFSAIYLWDEQAGYDGTQNNYKVIGNSGYVDDHSYPEVNLDYLQACQGFLVKSASGGGTLLFSRQMQIHQNTSSLLKSAKKSWDGFRLVVQSGDRNESTTLSFHEGMTLGLDPSYDAGLFSNQPDFIIYTRLINDDKGINFKIQCLPPVANSELEIPVGLNLKGGGEVTFSTRGVLLPEDHSIWLEDRWNDTLRDIRSEGGSYSVYLEEGAQEPGRFFLHIKPRTSTSSYSNQTDEPVLNVISSNQLIRIQGLVNASAKATLFDLQGRMAGHYLLQGGSDEYIPVSSQTPGLYLLLIADGNYKKAFKIVIQ